jgi:hypothetical protein
MTELLIDGFDKYGPVGMAVVGPSGGSAGGAGSSSGTSLGPLLLANEWTSLLYSGTAGGIGSYDIVAPLSSTGQAIRFGTANVGGVSSMQKVLSGSFATLIGGVRFQSNMQVPGGVSFFDAGSSQSAISIDITGTISMRSGSLIGTALQTSTASVSAGSTHYLEWQVTFGASAAYQVWLDGVSILSGTGNTRAGTTNNSANMFGLSAADTTNGGAVIFDDLYVFSTAGTTNNAPLLTNPRIETSYPNGDSQTQFTNGAQIVGQAYSATSVTSAPGANVLFLRRFTPLSSCTVNSISCIPAAVAAAANFKPAIYSDSSGVPGSLLSTGAQVTNAQIGTTMTGVLTTPQALTAGTNYWLGFITDTSVNLQQTDTTATASKVAATYTSGAPASPTGFTTGQPSWQIWGNGTGSATNWASQDDNPALSGLTYAFSSTVGQGDLYQFPALSTSPQAIYTVALKSFCAKTDTGTRTMNLNMKSGTASGSGSNTGIGPGTSYGWLPSFFTTDPNTGLAWTGSGLNAAFGGPSIAS